LDARGTGSPNAAATEKEAAISMIKAQRY